MRLGESRKLHRYVGQTGRKDVISKLKWCSNGMKQDLMIVSMFVSVEDCNGRVREKPAILCLDTNVDHVFGLRHRPMVPMPKRSDLSLRELDRTGKARREGLPGVETGKPVSDDWEYGGG